jgi:hypothetical protein
MDKFLLSFFGAMDKIMDRIFSVDDCVCGHRAHCGERCQEQMMILGGTVNCTCIHCNCKKHRKKK